MFSFIIYFSHMQFDKITSSSQFTNLLTYFLFLIHASLCNCRWVFTAPSMVIVTLIYDLYLRICLQIIEPQAIIFHVIIALIICYTTHQLESKLKHEFIQMEQIKKMNDDLSNLFCNMPEGIIIYDEESKDIILVNTECKKLFNCLESTDLNCFQAKVQERNIK